MTAIAAAVQSTGRVVVTVTGLPVDAVAVEVLRDTIEESSIVRGLVHETGTTSYVLVDHEAPLERPVFYVVRVLDPGGLWTETVTSSSVAVPAPRADDGVTLLPLLSDPITGESVAVTVDAWPEYTRESRGSTIAVAGRPDPVVVSDVVTYPSSSPILITRTRGANHAVRALLSNGAVVLLRAPAPEVEDDYLWVSATVETRVTNSGTDARRRHALTVQHVAMPSPEIAAVGDSLLALSEAVPTTLLDLSTTWGSLLDIAAADLGVL